jgi:TRAP-type C4-dicarboxylate transport system permease small subunit
MFLKGKAKDVYFLLGDIIVLLFTLFLVYDGFIVTNRMALRGLLTPAMQIPLYTMYISLPLGSLCVSIRLFVRVINELRALAGQVPAVGKEA